MAWYRAGGGGIPSSLKTGMNDILNKKFGTSQDYPPTDWAPTVNLMGPLPEKTVSGAIATFADGADAVPLKKCEITLPASLDGYSEVDVVASGKNLLPNTAQTATENGVTFTVNSDGTVSLSGTCNADTNFYIISGFSFPKLGQYFFSGCPSGGSTSTYRVFLTNYGADVGSGYLLNVSNLSTTTSISINIKSGVVTDGLVFKPMIEYGTTATTYEPYTAPDTHTASLGRTIYGGTADVVAGQGTDENRKFTVLNTSAWVNSISFKGSGNTAYIQINSSPASNGRWQDLACSHFTPANIYAGGTQQGIGCYQSQFYIRDSRFTSKQDFLDFLEEQETLGTPLEICYKLAATTDFTFDPISIDSKLGNNTIWSEQGDTEVTYRADINLALGGQ